MNFRASIRAIFSSDAFLLHLAQDAWSFCSCSKLLQLDRLISYMLKKTSVLLI